MGLNAATGDVLWDTQVGEGRYPDIVGTPVANETDVFASGYFGPLLAIDSQTRNVRWRVEAGAAATSTLMKVEAGEHLLHPGSDGTLRCIDTLTGGQVWSWSSGSNGALTRPHVTDAGILFGATDGGLYLVDPKTGEEIWRARYEFLLEGVTAAPLVSGRDVFYTSNAGNLYKMTAFDDDHMNATRTASGWTRIQR